MAPMAPRTDKEETQLREEIRKELNQIRRKGFHGFSVEKDCPTLGQLWSEPKHDRANEAVVRERLLVLLDPHPKDPNQRNPKKLIAGRERLEDGVANRIIFGEPSASIAIPRVGKTTIPDALKADASEILDTFTPSKLGIVKRNEFLADLRNESVTAIAGPRRPDDGRVGRVHLLLDRLADQIVADARATGTEVAEDSDQSLVSDDSDTETASSPQEPRLAVGESGRRSTHRFRRLATIGLPIVLAAGIVVVIIAGSRGHGPLADTPIRKTDCLSQLAANSSGGAGQIEGGDFVRAATGEDFSDPVTADPNSEVVVRLRLSNTGPSQIDAVCVSAGLPETATESSSVSVKVESLPTVVPNNTTDTTSIQTYPGQPVCLALVPGSTELLDRNGAVVESLPDQILDGGVQVGPIDVPLSSTTCSVQGEAPETRRWHCLRRRLCSEAQDSPPVRLQRPTGKSNHARHQHHAQSGLGLRRIGRRPGQTQIFHDHT
ncbi:MAG: hypothetical protein IPK93_12415 [Solirubrobacterales bacterium]|nr:hypothetical protein [Solirubrobacterales bacterium]